MSVAPPSNATLPPRDLALIAVVVLAWGSNFSAMRLALDALPPLLFVALRFAILLPLLALFPRRPAPWAALAGVALLINCGQFGFLFSAIELGLSAGMASLLIQMQAPMTIVLAALVYGETVSLRQALGLALALAGLAWIAIGETGAVPGIGLALVLIAALSWAGGNLILRRLPGVAMLPLFAWASLLAWPPMLVLSLIVEDPSALSTIAAMGARAKGGSLARRKFWMSWMRGLTACVWVYAPKDVRRCGQGPRFLRRRQARDRWAMSPQGPLGRPSRRRCRWATSPAPTSIKAHKFSGKCVANACPRGSPPCPFRAGDTVLSLPCYSSTDRTTESGT